MALSWANLRSFSLRNVAAASAAGFPVPARRAAHAERLMPEEPYQPLLGVITLPAEGFANLWIEPCDGTRDLCGIASGCQEFETVM